MNTFSHLNQWLLLQRKVASIATILVLIPFCLLAHSLQGQVLVFVINILMFGVCHGSLDYLRCPPDRNGHIGRLRLFVFVIAYIALAAILLCVWFSDPGPMLVSFLSVSCLHFALDEDDHFSLGKKLLRGFLPVFAPCFLHAAAVSEVFSFLMGTHVSFSTSMTEVLKILGGMTIGLAFSSLVLDFCLACEVRCKTGFVECTETLILLLSYVLLPPLLSFTIYFCWWHSVRQCLRQISRFDSLNFANGLSIFVRKSAVFTIGSWLLALVIFFVATNTSASIDISIQAVRAMFFLLSALTIPHMFLAMIGTFRPVAAH